MPPAQIGQYRLGDKLGEGGMGIVYAAEDAQLHRRVAVKLLRSEWSQEPKAVERFHREARITAALHHPHICAIYDFGEYEGHHYLVTELLEGQPLRDRLDGWPLPIEPMLDIAIQVADAIEAAHAQGVVHRDIKSSNIFITDTGIAKLFDFGLAKLIQKEPHGLLAKAGVSEAVSMPGITLGTVTHMSPEQVAGKELDHRSDIFSFGIVLYEMATGVLPFHGIDSVMIMQAIACEGYPQPSKINPNLPAEIDEIIGRTLQKECSERYQTMADLKADLIRLLQRLEHDGSNGVTASTGAIMAKDAESCPSAKGQKPRAPEPSPAPAHPQPHVAVEQWNVKGGGGRRFIDHGRGTMYWFHASLGEVSSPAGFRDSLQPALESSRITQVRFVLDPAEDGTPQLWSKLVVPLIQGWAQRDQRTVETILAADRGRFYDPTTERTLMSWIFTDLAEQGIPSFKLFLPEEAPDAAPDGGPRADAYVEAELLITTRLRSIRLGDGTRQELRVPDRVLRVHSSAAEPLAKSLLRIARCWEARFAAAPE